MNVVEMVTKKIRQGAFLIFLIGSAVLMGYTIHQKSVICNILSLELIDILDDQRRTIYYLSDKNDDNQSLAKLKSLDSLYISKVKNNYKYHPYLSCFSLQHALQHYTKLESLRSQLNINLKEEPIRFLFAKLRYNKIENLYDVDYYSYQDSSKTLYTKVDNNYILVDSVQNFKHNKYYIKNPVTKKYMHVNYVKFEDL